MKRELNLTTSVDFFSDLLESNQTTWEGFTIHGYY